MYSCIYLFGYLYLFSPPLLHIQHIKIHCAPVVHCNCITSFCWCRSVRSSSFTTLLLLWCFRIRGDERICCGDTGVATGTLFVFNFLAGYCLAWQCLERRGIWGRCHRKSFYMTSCNLSSGLRGSPTSPLTALADEDIFTCTCRTSSRWSRLMHGRVLIMQRPRHE